MKANKANDGGYLQLNVKLIDGPQTGTTGAYRLNLYHSNPQTAEIGIAAFPQFVTLSACSTYKIRANLHNILFIIELACKRAKKRRKRGYTEVKKVFDINGNEPGKAGQGAAPAQPQAQGGFGQQQPAQQPAAQPQGNAPAWGGQPQQPAAQPQQPACNAPAWGQQRGGAAPAGAAPWGHR